MNKETMTIHKALAELKTLDGRITKAVDSGVYVVTNRHSNEKIGGVTIAEYCNKTMKAGYESAVDLIRRRSALKRAVVLSNAKTIVKIDGVDYTVAEAIEMKNHGLEGKQFLLNEMQKQYTKAQRNIASFSGDDLQKKAENYVIGLFGGKDKIDSDAAKQQMEDYKKANAYDLIDPLDIQKIIQELDNEINNFMAEVDAALSVSNAMTTIEIEY